MANVEGRILVTLDVGKRSEIAAVVEKYRIETIDPMAAILSAVGERSPGKTRDASGNGLLNYGLDLRGLRTPGRISNETPPGGGTTDDAVEIFYAAAASGHDRCLVCEDTELPMMDMPDCVWAAVGLMDTSEGHLCDPAGRNVEKMSFLAGTSAEEGCRYLQGLSCAFIPDERQVMAAVSGRPCSAKRVGRAARDRAGTNRGGHDGLHLAGREHGC